MPGLALDTNAYRALDDGNQTLAHELKKTAQLAIPIVVVGELYFGIYNGARSAQNVDRLNRFLELPRLNVLQITAETAQLFGEIATELRRQGKPIQQNDIWIAALCKQYGYRLATNDAGFANILGLELLRF